MNIKGVIFDLDGTLLDSMSIWDTVGFDYLKSKNITPSPNLKDKIKALSIIDGAKYFQDEYGIKDDIETIMRDINKLLKIIILIKSNLKKVYYLF